MKIKQTKQITINKQEINNFLATHSKESMQISYNPKTQLYTITTPILRPDYEVYLEELNALRLDDTATTALQAEALNYAISSIKTLLDMEVLH